MESPAHSPVVKKITTSGINKKVEMNFPDAIREVIAGNKVARLEWEDKDPNSYMYLDGHLMISLESGKHTLLVRDVDMLGEDWVVV